ncbi:hypothetical protein LCGC14_1122670 [marine sediment metagenome]|uniref:AI-2E family transporter n=1 Tax=marine sediment metagenome TaxID=412755 RepID=A0A0F9PLP3_9ZZZZ|nr:AI-2E family transporter [Methylophaga sp.]HEC59021.1 AI-2E family transporter [Methylophaga sp.]
MTDSNKFLAVIVLVIAGWLLYALSPVLMPFLVSALLAYLADPIVDKLETKKLSRTVSVCIVFAVLLFMVLLLLLVVLPLLSNQISSLVKSVPDYLSVLQSTVVPWLNSIGLPVGALDINTLKETVSKYGAEFGQVAGGIMSYIKGSGAAVLQMLTNLFLVPVITFYLLRDWDLMVARFRKLLPRRHASKVIELTLECDDMLAAFIRGQLMVMVALSTLYTIGLALIGLDLSLLLGIIAGLVSFVPYLGLIVGIGLAGTAAFLQFHEWFPVLMVVVVFSSAQMIEGTVLTPRFVGERIGLHPVAVIFAVLAGGQLFGFAGILLALPAATVFMVLLRYGLRRYLDSQLYHKTL